MAVVTPFAANWLLWRLVRLEDLNEPGQVRDRAMQSMQQIGRLDLAQQVGQSFDQLIASAAEWRLGVSAGGSAEVDVTEVGAESSCPPPGHGLDTRTVADMLHLRSTRQVLNLVAGGRLSATKRGRGWVIDRGSVDAELERRSS